MTMLNISVEGVYESDTGSGQKQYECFSYTFKISKPIENGIKTHILRRFIPFCIMKDKKKSSKIFSRVHTFVITDIEKVEDNKGSIIGKDIREMDDWEIQDLACTFDLYEVPLPCVCSITELRDKATLAYMKKILKIKMDTPKDIQQLKFIKFNSDGSFKLDIKDKIIANVPPNYFEKIEVKEDKKDFSYFVDKIFGNKNATKNENDNDDEGSELFDNLNDLSDGNDFPSENALLS